MRYLLLLALTSCTPQLSMKTPSYVQCGDVALQDVTEFYTNKDGIVISFKDGKVMRASLSVPCFAIWN